MTDTKPSEREAFECHKLNQRMAGLLNCIAAAIKGDPGPHRMHSWHDLPDLAAQAMQAARATQSAQQEQDRIDAERYRWLRDNRESDWTICLWDGFEYIRGGLTPEIIDAGIDAARKGGRNG